jgi:predicted O-methyltransferase YrrM
MNQVLERILMSGVVTDGHSTSPLHSQISPGEGRFIGEVIATVQPSRSLEIGMAYGVSTLFICDALATLNKPTLHIVIDPFQTVQWHGIGLRNVSEAGYEKLVQFHEERAEFVLPRLAAEGTQVELAFVDGWHTFDQVVTEFYFINRMLAIGGVVIFDDADLPGVNRVLRHILTYAAYRRFTLREELDHKQSYLGMIRCGLAKVPGVAKLIRADVLHPSWELGLMGRYVALQKVGPDQRSWDWYEDF